MSLFMTSMKAASLNQDMRSKVSDGLAVLEVLLNLTPDFNDTTTFCCEEASLTWETLSTRISALQDAISVLVDREDDHDVEPHIISFDGESSDEDWADMEEPEGVSDSEDMESFSEAFQQHSNETSVKIEAIDSTSVEATSAIASAGHFTVHGSTLRDDASIENVSNTPTHGSIEALDTSTVEPVEFSFRHLSHQLSDLSNTLIFEWNRTKGELSAELTRRRDAELETNAALSEKVELAKQLQEAAVTRDAAITERDNMKALLKETSLLMDGIAQDNAEVSLRLEEVELERSKLAKEKKELLSRLETSFKENDALVSEKVDLETQVQDALGKTSAVMNERDDLLARLADAHSVIDSAAVEKNGILKRLNKAVSERDTLTLDNKALTELVGRTSLQRDAAQKLVDDSKRQIHALVEERDTLAREKEDAFELLKTANAKLDAEERRASALAFRNRCGLDGKASYKAKISKLENEVKLLRSEVMASQHLQLTEWEVSLRYWFFHPKYTLVHEVRSFPTLSVITEPCVKLQNTPAVDEIFQSLEYYATNFSVTHNSLKISDLLNTLSRISVLEVNRIPKDCEFNFRERARTLLERWQAVWDQGEK
ncbi:hypothetical protein ONZ45_g10405 [Pleurotus djamor]|nr:hypothetical protein ONZ45_g10405 [Pleurotus djamor]